MSYLPFLLLLVPVAAFGLIGLPLAAREGRMRMSLCDRCGHSQWMHHRGPCWHYKVLEDRMCDCSGDGVTFTERK